MTKNQKKRGRPAKAPKSLKRHQYGFRTRDALARLLETSATKNGRSVSEEVESWLEQWGAIRTLIPDTVDAGDIKRFGSIVALVRISLGELGLSPNHWPRFLHVFGVAHPDNPAFEHRIRHALRDAVCERYVEAKALVGKQGRRWHADKSPEENFEFLAACDFVDELARSGKLELVEAMTALNALERDPKIMERARNGDPEAERELARARTWLENVLDG